MMHRDGYIRLLASVNKDRKQEDWSEGAAAC